MFVCQDSIAFLASGLSASPNYLVTLKSSPQLILMLVFQLVHLRRLITGIKIKPTAQF